MIGSFYLDLMDNGTINIIGSISADFIPVSTSNLELRFIYPLGWYI